MKRSHLHTGKKGEDIAEKYLLSQKFKILVRNWRYKRSELDIIAQENSALVFIEVKTRSSSEFGSPESFVSARKELFMQEAASAYMEENSYNGEIRFDVIGILLNSDESFELNHYRDVFF